MRLLAQCVVVFLALSASALADGDDFRVDVARKFFDAYANHDMATLESLYAPDAKWSDPITSFSDRAGIMGMWKWEAAQSPKITYTILGSEGNQVRVLWKADYSLLGNPIHNEVTATLTIDDQGKVVEHRDDYSWETWAAQAFPAAVKLPVWPWVDEGFRLAVAGALQVESYLQNHPISKTNGLSGTLGDLAK